MDAQNVVFALVVLAATAFFYYSAQRLIRNLRIGRADPRWDRPAARLWNVLRIAIFQKKIFRDPVAGPMHALIFWGFLVLTAGTLELIVHGMIPAFSLGAPTTYSAFSQVPRPTMPCRPSRPRQALCWRPTRTTST